MVAEAGKSVLAMGSSGPASRAVLQTARHESRVAEEARKALGSRYGATVITSMPYKRHFESIPALARQPDGTLMRIAGPRGAAIAIGY
jgi:hypothetical protein